MVIGTLALLSISFMFFVNFDVNRVLKGEGDLKTMLTFTLATMEVIELET